MAIPDLPPAPDPATDSPSDFSLKAAASVLAQRALPGQINAEIGALFASLASGTYALAYQFDTATADADPGPGKLRLSNATQNAAAAMRLDVLSGNQDVSSFLDTFDASTSSVKGSIKLVKKADFTKWLSFDVIARAAPGGYRNLTVVNTGGSSASPFAADDTVLLFFQRNGDAGGLSQYPSAKFSDQKPSGTWGGSAATSSPQTRTLNTVNYNTIAGASLASNQITLPAGTYEVAIRTPGAMVQHKAALWSVTANAYVMVGSNECSTAPGGGTGTATTTNSFVTGRLTLASTSVLLVRQFGQGGTYSHELGYVSGSGQVEVYTEAIFTKIG